MQLPDSTEAGLLVSPEVHEKKDSRWGRENVPAQAAAADGP